MKGKLIVVIVVGIAIVAAAFSLGLFNLLPFIGQPTQFTATLTGDKTNLTVQLNVTVTGGVAPFTYIWDFGDNTTRITATGALSYTYAKAGTYTVTVLVRSTDDKLAEASTTVTVAA